MKPHWVWFGAFGLASALGCAGKSLNDVGDINTGGAGEGGASEGGTGGTGAKGGTGGTGASGAGSGATGGAGIARGGSTGAIGGAPGGIGGTTGAFGGTGATTGGSSANGVVLMPNADGWVELDEPSFRVQGSYYVFGDQYFPNARCLMPGLHRDAECSIIETPVPPPALGFPQVVPGEMCTSGSVAQVLACAPEVTNPGCPGADYYNMFGAGLAIDFNADKGEDGGQRHPWDAAPGGFIGFSFEINAIPIAGLRVTIPIVLTDEEAAANTPPLPPGSTTDSHNDASPYWGATSMYPSSPVTVGINRVLWTDIRPPRPQNYTFDTTRMLGIQFHIPTNTLSRTPYGFCIRNLTLLRE